MFARRGKNEPIDAAAELERREQERIEGERGASELGAQQRQSPPGAKTFLAVLVVAIGALGVAFTIKAMQMREAEPTETQQSTLVRNTLPEYGDGWKFKIVIDGGTEGRINRFRLVAQSPDGAMHERDLALADYLTIVAATNFKQRIRKTLEYFHADRLNYGVVGTPNRVEYDQGFFVKNGDGSADVKPIAHLYKSQVYGMARHLGLPERVCAAIPTTDTYSLSQGQDEFYFALPYQQMDLALWALNHGRPASELAIALGITPEHAQAVYDDIRNKRRTTKYLHMAPVLAGDVPELD